VSMTYYLDGNMTSQVDGARGEMTKDGMNYLQARSTVSHFWDVEHSCRALEPIEAWVAGHQA
jgi:hypothetical protein